MAGAGGFTGGLRGFSARGRRRLPLPPAPIAALVRGLSAASLALEGARGHLLPFAPVLLAVGIGTYFALPAEPGPELRGALALAALALALVAFKGPLPLRLPAMAVALVLAGALVSAWRSERVAAPVLNRSYYGPVEGRLIWLDRSASGAARLTLDRVVLPGRPPAFTPARVRVTFQGDALDFDPPPGTRLALTGSLSPPGGPVEPGGFDFRRLAWFERLGAVGYTHNPAVVLAPPEPGLWMAIARLRQTLSAAIQAGIPGPAGTFTASILTGDRFPVERETIEALRDSNLAHLLAVSGLHMGLLTGVVYATLRCVLALIPPLALRIPVRKLAALGALAVATFYLLLSGGNIATQRAYVMTAVVLGAVLLDRQALSLRSVALAALIVLLWRPEALLTAGFQMSFAATVALIACFAELRRRRALRPVIRGRRRPGWQRGLKDGAICSVVSDAATAPVGMAHFSYFADYGVPANLVAVPAMGLVIMPGAVVTALLWPLGLDWIGYKAMGLGAGWVLAVAHWAAGMEDAVRGVGSPPAWALPAMGLGALWLMLWPGRARLAGIAVMAVAALGWGQAPRPMVLIASDGALVGVMREEGRALSRARGGSYTARNWLEADGDIASQAQAAARPGFTAVEGGAALVLGGQVLIHLHGRPGIAALDGHCRDGAWIVLAARHEGPVPGNCTLWDEAALSATGALALDLDPATGRMDPRPRTVRDLAGQRPWTKDRPPR